MDVLEAHVECRVVVLVAHGLNLRAHGLRDVYEPLRERGAAIVVLCLRGHSRDSAADAETLEAWKSVDAAAWVGDWLEAVGAAEEMATNRGVPLVFLGYSLGALLHVYCLAAGHPERNPFARQVLLAPAVRVRGHTRLVLVFRPLGRRFTLPSFAPADLRSHARTSMAAYETLFGLEAALDTMAEPGRVKIPTLVVMDPGDELVSQTRLAGWIGRHGLAPEWRMRSLAKDTATAGSRIRHYIIDQRSLGRAAYETLTRIVGEAVIDGVMDVEPGPGAGTTR